MMTYAEELLKEGLEQGLAQWREQGLERGSLQRSRDILVRQMDRRFGLTLPVIKTRPGGSRRAIRCLPG